MKIKLSDLMLRIGKNVKEFAKSHKKDEKEVATSNQH